jgi:hypothetical protein
MAVNKNEHKQDAQETEPLAELHKLREERAKKFDYDLKAMFEDLKAFEKKQKIKTVSLTPKRTMKKTGT